MIETKVVTKAHLDAAALYGKGLPARSPDGKNQTVRSLRKEGEECQNVHMGFFFSPVASL